MDSANDSKLEALEQFRPYLMLLASAQLNPRIQAKLDASDIVQQTLAEGHRQANQFRGRTNAEMAGWLRQILAHNLADAFREMGRAKRNVARERSLEQELNQTSARLEGWLVADRTSPSQPAQRQERAMQIAQALAGLPERQREALVLQYWHGWSLAEIGKRLNRSAPAVAGLLARGLAKLRESLSQDRSES